MRGSWSPIFLAFSSPDSMIAITSALRTPSRLATSAGASRSGTRHAAAAAAAGCGRALRRRPADIEAALLNHLLRDAESDRQLGRRAARAAATRLAMPLRHLILHVIVQVADRRHARSLVDRRSTSGGTDTFSTMKLVISRPYFAPTTGLITGSSASPSSE